MYFVLLIVYFLIQVASPITSRMSELKSHIKLNISGVFYYFNFPKFELAGEQLPINLSSA